MTPNHWWLLQYCWWKCTVFNICVSTAELMQYWNTHAEHRVFKRSGHELEKYFHMHIVIRNNNRNIDLSIRTRNLIQEFRNVNQLMCHAGYAFFAPCKSTFPPILKKPSESHTNCDVELKAVKYASSVVWNVYMRLTGAVRVPYVQWAGYKLPSRWIFVRFPAEKRTFSLVRGRQTDLQPMRLLPVPIEVRNKPVGAW
jgi:hypothetical protein